MANAGAKYKIACDSYVRAAKEKDDATLALSQAKRNLDAADRAFDAAKDAKEEAFKVLGACSSIKRKIVSDDTDEVLDEPAVVKPAKKKVKSEVSKPTKKASKPSTLGEIVELQDLILEKGMTPSRGGGRPCRDEREFLRFYAQFGKIEKKSRWKWSRDEDDYVKIERMLHLFKNGMKAPSNFRKINEWKDEEWSKYDLE